MDPPRRSTSLVVSGVRLLRMAYRLARTHEKRTVDLELRILYERSGNDWRSAIVTARR